MDANGLGLVCGEETRGQGPSDKRGETRTKSIITMWCVFGVRAGGKLRKEKAKERSRQRSKEI